MKRRKYWTKNYWRYFKFRVIFTCMKSSRVQLARPKPRTKICFWLIAIISGSCFFNFTGNKCHAMSYISSLTAKYRCVTLSPKIQNKNNQKNTIIAGIRKITMPTKSPASMSWNKWKRTFTKCVNSRKKTLIEMDKCVAATIFNWRKTLQNDTVAYKRYENIAPLFKSVKRLQKLNVRRKNKGLH